MIFSAYYSFTNYGVTADRRLRPDEDRRAQELPAALPRPVRRQGAEEHLRVRPDDGAGAHHRRAPARLILMRIGERLGGVFRTIFYLPHITPPVAVGVLVLTLFNGPYGVVNKGLTLIHVNGPVLADATRSWIKPTIAIMDVWACGGTMVILLAALYGVPRHLYEAAAMDGASKLRQFFNVTLPMISPALFFCFIILTLAALNQFAVALHGVLQLRLAASTNGAALFYAIYLFQQAFKYFNMGFASAMAWLLFAISMVDHRDQHLRHEAVRLLPGRARRTDGDRTADRRTRLRSSSRRDEPDAAGRCAAAGGRSRRSTGSSRRSSSPCSSCLVDPLPLSVRVAAQRVVQDRAATSSTTRSSRTTGRGTSPARTCRSRTSSTSSTSRRSRAGCSTASGSACSARAA